jgi:hypothetical protein
MNERGRLKPLRLRCKDDVCDRKRERKKETEEERKRWRRDREA